MSKSSVVVLLLGVDLIGGVVTNSTSAAKRWYHRDGQGFKEHMTFIAIHAMQIATVAVGYVVVDDGHNYSWNSWSYFGCVYGTLLVASWTVLTVPLYLQRPVAMSMVAASLPGSRLLLLSDATPGLDWFIPLLFLKLLVAHLTYETSFQQVEKRKGH